jgi:outer membrane protein OmpA-like peptidoglycan-associated protein
MSAAQRCVLALWAALLAGVVCLAFLPLSRPAAALVMVALWGIIASVWYLNRRRVTHQAAPDFANLPDAAYRHPVVLVCGDMPQAWPEETAVLTVAQGCWIRVEEHQDPELVARQLLWLRPDWGRQLSIMIVVCPQRHRDTEALASRLLAVRWQIGRLRRDTGYSIPLILSGVAGSVIMRELLWQAAIPGEGLSVWRESAAPRSVASWVTTGGAVVMQQQVLINCLMAWFQQHVQAVFIDENPDIPRVVPAAVLWGCGPALSGCLPSSVWTEWLQRHTAMADVAGWRPNESITTANSLLPDFVLPLLPEGQGLTPRQRTWRSGLALFTAAAVAALCSSGWNNRQLLQRLSFDIHHYQQISPEEAAAKATAVGILREDAAQLDDWARNGEPPGMGLGLYQGERLRMPVLDAIRSYVPPSPPPPPPEIIPEPAPEIIRLDSMSLFDSGQWRLKPGSTKVLVNALVGIRAKPGWLIIVAGHTDSTGDERANQALSLKRAGAVRDWMLNNGDVPESCFAVQGYGESRPVATNDTAEGRALNRRVEISLVPQAGACRLPE